MTGVANFQRDLMNTIAEPDARTKFVGYEQVGLGGEDAVNGGRPFVAQYVVVEVPRIRGVEFHF